MIFHLMHYKIIIKLLSMIIQVLSDPLYKEKRVEQSSAKSQVNGLCWKLCLLKQIQLLSNSRTWIHRPYSSVLFLEWAFLKFNQIMYYQLTFRLTGEAGPFSHMGFLGWDFHCDFTDKYSTYSYESTI